MTVEEKLARAIEALEAIASLRVGPDRAPYFGVWHDWERDHAIRARENEVVGEAQLALLDIDPERPKLPEPKGP